MATIAVLGTYDSKGLELDYVAGVIAARGHKPLRIDVGTHEAPAVTPDITRETVLGGASLTKQGDRGSCVSDMARLAPAFVSKLVAEGRIQGIISLGGGGGTAIGTACMRVLPVGFPKVMVSTLASGNTSPYIGTKDIVMFPSVVDVAGLNRVSRLLFARAAGAICGMVETVPPAAQDRPIIAASMFGNTTACVGAAQKLLEAAGYEVLVFHATGTGGKAMEALIEAGLVVGSFDITTTEWADELCGGILTAGSTRLDAAAKAGIPTVIAPGCLDMVNFGEPATVPAKFNGRTFYHHNPQVTLMRTNAAECAQLGRILAEKANAYAGPVTVLLPLKAISVISAPGQPFHDPAADAALFDAIRKNLRPGIPLVELDCAINDPAFAQAAVAALLGGLKK